MKKGDSIPNIKRFDFVLTFETQGTTFIFEDLVATHYKIRETVSICRKAIIRAFFSKQAVKEMNERGKSLSMAETQKMLDSIRVSIKKANEAERILKTKSVITLKETRDALELMGKIMSQYEYFDMCYWDEAFQKAEIEKRVGENVKLVSESKNVIRAEINPIFFDQESYLYLLTGKLAKQFNQNSTDIRWYSAGELLKLFDNKVLTKEEIEERKKLFILYTRPSRDVLVYTEEEGEKIADLFEDKIDQKDKIIRGVVAHSTGKNIIGTVKIISRNYESTGDMNKQMNQMKKGEILVSETTDPALMPAIRKASALITDIGGMLSHTAIVARELNIPCIIGTNFASKKLKTGDMIEVDAEQGIVKILKS